VQPSRFWWSQLQIPLAIFVVTATLLALTPLDEHIARAVFYDSASAQWIGSRSWVINELLHTGGRWAIRAIVAIALAFLAATFVRRDWRAYRRPAAFFAISTILSMGLVGVLKNLTNVDCPWDLIPFGGRFPYVELFADRPDALRAGRCFPAAHASSGYALLALYFVFRERHAPLAKLGLALGLLTGLTFGLVQQARGAHFVSHDLWSAFLVWTVTVSVYAFAFRGRLWETTEHEAAPAGRLAPDLHVAGDTGLGGGLPRPEGQRSAGRTALGGPDLHLQHADRTERSAHRD
jgi:membrane-associated PAP2 superfamily phosphatase